MTRVEYALKHIAEPIKYIKNCDKLSPKIKEVLIARLTGHTFASIGKKINYTRERIRQMESKGIRVLLGGNEKYSDYTWSREKIEE